MTGSLFIVFFLFQNIHMKNISDGNLKNATIVLAKERENVLLKCPLKTLDNWRKVSPPIILAEKTTDGTQINPTYAAKFQVMEYCACLLILSFTSSDEGTYQCTSTDSYNIHVVYSNNVLFSNVRSEEITETTVIVKQDVSNSMSITEQADVVFNSVDNMVSSSSIKELAVATALVTFLFGGFVGFLYCYRKGKRIPATNSDHDIPAVDAQGLAISNDMYNSFPTDAFQLYKRTNDEGTSLDLGLGTNNPHADALSNIDDKNPSNEVQLENQKTLTYIEVSFESPDNKDKRKFKIRGDEERTNYTDIDFCASTGSQGAKLKTVTLGKRKKYNMLKRREQDY